MANIKERPLNFGDADAAVAEPYGVELSGRQRDWIVAVDLLQLGEDARVRSEASEHFDEGAQSAARCVENSKESLRIVPSVPEGPVRCGVRPVRKRPRIRKPGDSVERTIRRDRLERDSLRLARFSHR